MKTVLIAVLATACALLGACATVTPQQTSALQARALATIPHCTTQRQCEGEWAAARDWVTANCAMKIQTMTDSFIETYNAVGGEPGLACRVTKDPIPSGGYAITVAANCDNMFGCVPNQWVAIVDFNEKVNDAGKAFASPAVAAGVR